MIRKPAPLTVNSDSICNGILIHITTESQFSSPEYTKTRMETPDRARKVFGLVRSDSRRYRRPNVAPRHSPARLFHRAVDLWVEDGTNLVKRRY